MAHFEINLIRDRTLPRPLRKGLFWGLLAYLVLSGLGLAVVAHRAALRFVDATAHAAGTQPEQRSNTGERCLVTDGERRLVG